MVRLCEKCGSKPDPGSTLTEVRKSFRSTRIQLCSKCQKKRENIQTIVVFSWTLVATAIITKTSPSIANSSLTHILLNLIIGSYLLIPLSVLIHELAHALAALLCRFRIFTVEMGWRGKELLNFPIKRTRWILRWFPSNGLCRMAPRSRDRLRSRLFIVIAAAPLTNLLIAVSISLIEPLSSLLSLRSLFNGFNPLYLTFWSNLFLVFSALRPKLYQTGLGELFSDGMQLMMILKNNQKLLDDSHKSFFVMEATEFVDAEDFARAETTISEGLAIYPDDAALWVTLATIQFYGGQRTTSLKTMIGILEKTDPKNPNDAIIKNNIAYFSAVLGDECHYAKADRYSQEALETNGLSDAFRSTRGAVLIRLGEFERGLEHLHKSIDGNSTPQSRAENLIWISLAHYKMEDLDKANLYLRQANELHPNSPMMGEMVQYLTPGNHS